MEMDEEIRIFIDSSKSKEFESVLKRSTHKDRPYNHKPLVTSYGIMLVYKEETGISIFILQRPHSLEYHEFISGCYYNKNLYSIFSLMTQEERRLISTYDFDYLYDQVYGTCRSRLRYRAQRRFNSIKYIIHSLLDLTKSNRTETEWFYPKGQAKRSENNLVTAEREFKEEAGFFPRSIRYSNYIIEDSYVGSNERCYKSIYYIGETDNKYKTFKRRLSGMRNITPRISYEASNAMWIHIKNEKDINNVKIPDRLKTLTIDVFRLFV